MQEEDLKRVPAYYRSLVLPVMQFRDEETRTLLINGLTEVRDAHDHMADVQKRLLDKFDTPGLREGREKGLEDTRTSLRHCRDVASALDRVIEELRALT